MVLGPNRQGIRGRTWSSASGISNARARGDLPLGTEWDRPFHLDRVEGGDAPVRGLNFGDQDRRRNRVQSLGVSTVRKRVSNFSGNVEGFPPPSD